MSFDQFPQVKSLLVNSSKILVIFGPKSSLDEQAAASSLFLTLVEAGKEAILASPVLPKIASPHLIGLDEVKTDISNQNLIISFDYQAEAVDKVNYHIGEETNRFYLTIQPQPGKAPLNKESIEVNYAGAAADLIFLIGVHDLEDLETIYLSNESLFKQAPVVTIHAFAPEIEGIHLTTEGCINLSDCVAKLIQALELTPPAEAATNLLLSLEKATDHFRSLSTTAEVFELVAWLMRQGARRIKAVKPTNLPAAPVARKSQLAGRPTKG